MTTQPTGASATGPGLVEVVGLTKSYRATTALRDYNLSLEAGHIVGLMGPNGCGKTTLLKILAGVLSDYEGTVTIDGHSPGVATKEIVSYLPDADYLNPEWTAADAIRIYSTFFADFDAVKAASMVDFFGLPTDRRLGEMSKGLTVPKRTAGRFVATDDTALYALRQEDARAAADAFIRACRALGVDVEGAHGFVDERWNADL